MNYFRRFRTVRRYRPGAWLAVALVLAGAFSSIAREIAAQAPRDADVIIVGAGISGLSAAFEAGRRGARVKVMDIWSTFGGHAVVAGGVLNIVGTPLQKANGIQDSTDLAYRDFLDWGDDPDPQWVRYYVEHSTPEIFEWLAGLGVEFTTIGRNPGNSVPRVHAVKGGGMAEVAAIFLECLKYPNIEFVYNQKVVELISENQKITGVRAQNLRTGANREFRAPAVVLATGGFESNLQFVREFWPQRIKFPERLLIGSGIHATGSGLMMARDQGAASIRMDHQWIYSTGLPDPRYPGSQRGLRAIGPAAIWLNADGRRFVNESESFRVTVPAVASQKGSTYWSVFDQSGRAQFRLAGTTGWDDSAKAVLEKYPGLIKTAETLEELARAAGLPEAELAATVERYNGFVDKGLDPDFKRFGPGITAAEQKARESYTPAKIATPPFYAVPLYVLTRKSMGGVAVDLSCRVLDAGGHPIPGLYAVGEVTGFAGINGKAGLEGTFLGPSIVTGRAGGRSVLADLNWQSGPIEPVPAAPRASEGASGDSPDCASCHRLAQRVKERHAGFDHFERSHQVVLEQGLECARCHPGIGPPGTDRHRLDPSVQARRCSVCHKGA